MISFIKQTGTSTCYVCGDIHDYRVRVNNSLFYVYIYDISAPVKESFCNIYREVKTINHRVSVKLYIR